MNRFLSDILDGGNSNIFGIITHNLGKKITQFDELAYLSDGLVQLNHQRVSDIWFSSQKA